MLAFTTVKYQAQMLSMGNLFQFKCKVKLVSSEFLKKGTLGKKKLSFIAEFEFSHYFQHSNLRME